MRVSLHTGKTINTVAWVKRLELYSGGIAAKPGGTQAYPEVTGYLIPTLLDYGEDKLALRLARWLLTMQGDDGSFTDMHGTKRTFDSSACMEGLLRAYAHSLTDKTFSEGAEKARKWIRSHIRKDGAIATMPGNRTYLYTMRSSWLVQSREGAEYWKKTAWEGEMMRTHYIAYALEGLWNMGEKRFVKEMLDKTIKLVGHWGLMPFMISSDWLDGSGTDACATAQMAILYHQAGMDASRLVDGVQSMVEEEGGVRFGRDNAELNAWTAKWYLDMIGKLDVH